VERRTDSISELTKREYEFVPQVEDRRYLLASCRDIQSVLAANVNGTRQHALNQLRSKLRTDMAQPCDDDRVASLFVRSVLLDLVAQDWTLDLAGPKLRLSLETPVDESALSSKARVRRGHLLDRDSQLQQTAVSDFLNKMERRRLHPKNGWVSIYSLMRDGEDLAGALRGISPDMTEDVKEPILQQAISPYLQFVEGDAVCEHTGLRLMDIWRYFRHTWINSYKSLPGRSIQVLIRDAAVPFHPVIGIAALGSSIAQQSARDSWVGWRASEFIQSVADSPDTPTARWALERVQSLIDQIYVRDLLTEKLIERADFKTPTKRVISALRKQGQLAIARHRLYPQRTFHKPKEGFEGIDWVQQAKSDLFKSKRCLALARLFNIRRIFIEAGLTNGTRDELRNAAKSKSFREALGQLIRMIKAEHVGIDMMDIIVCGAIAPYNVLLGGKLACLLLCSPEIVNYYKQKYDRRVSIIASAVAGKPITRKPRLVLLGTTSLYGFGSSQYNRIKMNATLAGGEKSDFLEYRKLGRSEGYGSFHFSKDTLHLLETLLARTNRNRMVNSIFGEGVNPLMRKIRQALDYVGLPSDLLLRHGNQRVIYGVTLATNFREILLGRAQRPKYIIPCDTPELRTTMLADFWRKRWLASRLNFPGVLDQVALHRHCHPLQHGAVVQREREVPGIELLWD
jgi:hypothetical protein